MGINWRQPLGGSPGCPRSGSCSTTCSAAPVLAPAGADTCSSSGRRMGCVERHSPIFNLPHWNYKMSGVRRACLSFVVPYRGCRHGKIQTEKFLASPITWCLYTAGVVIAVCWQQFSHWFFGYWEIWLMLLCCSILRWKSIIWTVTAGEGLGPLESELPEII